MCRPRQDGRARHFHFTLSERKQVSVSLTAGALYVSKGTPGSGWGAEPGGETILRPALDGPLRIWRKAMTAPSLEPGNVV